jgi:hypothetical protein
MEFLSDRLYVKLAKKAGYPSLEQLRQVRDLQEEWINTGTPATLFMVSQIEGVIDVGQTRQFESWARQIVSSSGRIRKVDAPTEEVAVEHAFKSRRVRAQPKPVAVAVPVTVEVVEVVEVVEGGPWMDDDELVFDDDSDVGPIEPVADGDLKLLPDSDEIDLQNLSRFASSDPECVLDEDDLELIPEEDVSELIKVSTAWSPSDSNADAFAASEHTELFSDDEDDLDAAASSDPLADVLACLDEQDSGRQSRQSSGRRKGRRKPDSVASGLLHVCDDSDEPPALRLRRGDDSDTGPIETDSGLWGTEENAVEPRTRAVPTYSEDEVLQMINESSQSTRHATRGDSRGDSSCEDGLLSRAKKRLANRDASRVPRSRSGRVPLKRTRSAISRRWN